MQKASYLKALGRAYLELYEIEFDGCEGYYRAVDPKTGQKVFMEDWGAANDRTFTDHFIEWVESNPVPTSVIVEQALKIMNERFGK